MISSAYAKETKDTTQHKAKIIKTKTAKKTVLGHSIPELWLHSILDQALICKCFLNSRTALNLCIPHKCKVLVC